MLSGSRKVVRSLAGLFPPTASLLQRWDAFRIHQRRIERIEVFSSAALRGARDHLRRAVEASSRLPDAGSRWAEYSAISRKAIEGFTSTEEAILFAQDPATHNGFEARAKRHLLQEIGAREENSLRSAFPQYAHLVTDFSESPYSDPQSTAEYNGRLVSSSMYLLATYCLFCLDALPRLPNVVCEIGGGTGAPARTWLTNPIHRPVKYIIVDLPESLFFSEMYLTKHFGVENVFYVCDRSEATTRSIESAQIVLCPNAFLDMLAPIAIDLAINTNSLQEMSEEYVDFFMGWLDRQDCQYFFSSNYALQDIRDLRESMNTWSPRMSPLWKTRFLKLFPDPDCIRPTARALYEKSPNDVSQRKQEAAQKIEELLSVPLNGESLLCLLDAVRLGMEKEHISDLVRKAAAEYPIEAKEMVYLSSWLRDSPPLARCNRGINISLRN